MLRIDVPLSEIEFSFVRSSGPGGQNVNKVNSKAVLRWNVAQTQAFTPELRARLLSRLAARLTGEGELVLQSDRFRDQTRNREDCLAKLREILEAAVRVPKIRRETKPSKSSVRRAKEAKRRHSEKKRLRRGWD